MAVSQGRELLILWAGRHQRSEWEDLCGDYRGRVSRSVPVRERFIKSRAAGDGRARLAAEGQALMAAVPDPAWVVALDRTGRGRSSEELAAWLARLRADWPHPVAFVIGSDLGLAKEVLENARERISLGPLTLPHELARLVLYEQLYRALCIEAGIKYHRQPLGGS
ncbi:MAG: 23S rRNA (pseudouridine(1915)-N(3))-methyltransferase RlmH [Acidobacteriota bacterium]|nr:23S rRNA (pseudouridine(1915)-N(3))-methyltransferase RlmH [Acidobacteriota bacterium]